MSTITIDPSESVHARYLRLAEAQGVRLDQLLAGVLDDGVQSLEDAACLEMRAAQAVPGAMRRVLDRVPADGPVEKWDRLPPGWPESREEVLAMFGNLPVAPAPTSVAPSRIR